MISEIIESIGVSSEEECEDVKYWSKVATASLVTSSLLQAVAMCTAPDSQRLFECFSVLSFCSMGMLKLYSLRTYRTRWLDLVALMRRLDSKYTSLNDKPDVEYESDDEVLDLGADVEEYTTQFDFAANLLLRVYHSTLVGFTSAPFIEYIYVRATGGSPSYPHILPSWAPLEQLHFAWNIVSVLLEFVVAAFCVVVHLAFDRLSAGLMIFAKGQFLMLRRYCEHIGGKGRKCNVTKTRDARAMYRIKYSHETSIILIEFVEKLEKILVIIMGVYYLQVTLTLCTVAMRLNTVLSTTQMASLLQYLGATLTQLFLYCYYGDGVQYASAVSLGQGPSGAAFWCLSPRVRRSLALLSVGMLRPRRLRAGAFHYLDLPAFTMIVQAAYSYYAVLRS